MKFYPPDVLVPGELRTDEFLLRPLTTDHVELDYAALMDSKEMLRVWEQSDWPADDFTLEENWQDLDRHQKEYQAREAFTYTVLNPSQTECLGCVYIYPLATMLCHLNATDDQLDAVGDFEATVSFWVRQPRLADDLDQQLLQSLLAWFRSEWSFSRLVISTYDRDQRQVELLKAAGLDLRFSVGPGDSGATYLMFDV